MTGIAQRTSKDVVREFLRRIGAGDDPWALLAEDVVVSVNGTTPLSGRFPGKALVRSILVDTARTVIAALEVGIEDLIGTDTRIAALLKVSGRSVAGVSFNDDGRLCGCVFGVRGGLIDEVVFFPDTCLVETALFGRRFVPDARH